MNDRQDTVLVIAAHPDDEVLGCGGSLARHAAAGDVVHCLFLADGESARGADTAPERAARKASAAEAAKLLGCQAPRHLDFPDNRLDTVPLLDIVQAIEAVMAELSPSVLYVHHGGDLNVDHRVAHEAAMTAARPLPGASVRAIYAFEVLSSTGWRAPSAGGAFAPTRFVDISSHETAKLAALDAYGSELREYPHARSVRAVQGLHAYRGATVGLTCAEAFVVEREVVASAPSGAD